MSKYNAQKTNGFDSRKEERRWYELQALQRAGQISELRRQVKYELLPSQKRDARVVERAVHYIADFTYIENGEQVVEDVKPTDRYGNVSAYYKKTAAYKEYVLKRKLMLFRFGIRIREV